MTLPAFWPFTDEGRDDPYPAYAAQRAARPVDALPDDGVAVAVGHRQVRALLRDLAARPLACPRPPSSAAATSAAARRCAARSSAWRPQRFAPARAGAAPTPACVRPARRRRLAGACARAGKRAARPRRARARADGRSSSSPLWRTRCSVPCSTTCSDWTRRRRGAALAVESGGGVGRRDDAGLPADAPLPAARAPRVRRAPAQARASRDRAAPMTVLVQAAAEDPDVTELELIANLIFVLTSGHRSGAQALALAVHSLARHPDQFERLRREPELVPGAVEELLRWDGPVQSTSRVLAEDVDLDGHALRAGDLAVLVLGAANRDPDAFPAPERLDVGARAAASPELRVRGPLLRRRGAHADRAAEALAALVERAPQPQLAGNPSVVALEARLHEPSGALVKPAPANEEQVRRLTGERAQDLLALEGFPDDSDAVVYLSGSLVVRPREPVVGHRPFRRHRARSDRGRDGGGDHEHRRAALHRRSAGRLRVLAPRVRRGHGRPPGRGTSSTPALDPGHELPPDRGDLHPPAARRRPAGRPRGVRAAPGAVRLRSLRRLPDRGGDAPPRLRARGPRRHAQGRRPRHGALGRAPDARRRRRGLSAQPRQHRPGPQVAGQAPGGAGRRRPAPPPPARGLLAPAVPAGSARRRRRVARRTWKR